MSSEETQDGFGAFIGLLLMFAVFTGCAAFFVFAIKCAWSAVG